jgi:hypothetical protein
VVVVVEVVVVEREPKLDWLEREQLLKLLTTSKLAAVLAEGDRRWRLDLLKEEYVQGPFL